MIWLQDLVLRNLDLGLTGMNKLYKMNTVEYQNLNIKIKLDDGF